MTESILILALLTAISATSFVVLASIWFKKLRTTVETTLQETVNQQIKSVDLLDGNVKKIQEKQNLLEQQLHILAMATSKIQQDYAKLTIQIEPTEPEDTQRHPPADKTVH